MAAVQLRRFEGVCERLTSPQWLRSEVPPVPSRMSSKRLRIADLFCGAGGMTLGAVEAACAYSIMPTISFAADINATAMAVYSANFNVKKQRAFVGDIGDLLTGTVGRPPHKLEQQLVERLGHIDAVLAGPPCQGHSDLNNHTRRDDSRNWLYLKAIRFAELFRPQVVVVENVRTVILDRNEVVSTGSEILRKLGYSVQELVLNVSELGLPQLRKRHVLFATIVPVPGFRTIPADAPPLSIAINDLLDEASTATGDIYRTPSQMSKENIERVKYLFKKDKYDLPNRLRPACHRDNEHSYVSMYGRLDWNKPAQTITSGFGSPGQGRYIHPHRQRVITPHEAARIQGFPDYFSFERVKGRVKLQELIANAVPPVLVAALLEHAIINGGFK